MQERAVKTILLVDDHRVFLTTLADQLRDGQGDLCILTAENGENALNILDLTQVDLVVTDLRMPGMSGFDLISHMNKKYPVIPVIVISSFLTAESETRLRALGVSQCIDKQSLEVTLLEEIIVEKAGRDPRTGLAYGSLDNS